MIIGGGGRDAGHDDGARACGEPSRTMSKTTDGATTEYVLDLAAKLPVVISDTEAVYLYGLDIIAEQQAWARFITGCPKSHSG